MKNFKALLVAMLIIPALFVFAACGGGQMQAGTYKLSQFTYGEHTFNLDGDVEDLIAQFEEMDFENMDDIGFAIAIIFLAFGNMELEVSGNQMIFKMDMTELLDDIPGVNPEDLIVTTTINYTLNGDKIVLSGATEAELAEIEEMGSFTYKNGVITLTTTDEDTGLSFGMVFKKV